MIWITSSLWLAAGILAVYSLKPAWDELARRICSDQWQAATALGIDESHVRTGIYVWGGLMILNLVGLGLLLQMFPIAAALAILLLLAPRWVLAWAIRRRRDLIRDQMVGSTLALAHAARAGQSLAQGLQSVSREAPQPLASELQRIVGEYELGRTLPEALREARHRLQIDSFSMFTAAIIVSLQRGGRVTESLEKISRSLQENQRIERKLAAETASGWRVVLILTAFPFLFLAGFFVLHPEGTTLMLETLAGQLLLLAALGLVVGSLWWSRKILTIEL